MAEEIAYEAKELDGISVTLKRIADDIPMEVDLRIHLGVR